MASSSRTIRATFARLRQPQQPWTRSSSTSSFAHLQQDLPQRAIQPTFEDLSPQSSYRLDMTLADFLPKTNPPPVLPPTSLAKELPIPHHLLYFEPSKPQSAMLPDGTNPDQSPGEPFTRRMWAGGRVLYNQNNPLLLDGSRGVCQEFIRRVDIKGAAGQEKIFVAIERRLAKASSDEISRLEAVMHNDTKAKEALYHRVRQRLWRDSEEDFGECSILETRNIVFMRGRTPAEARADAAKPPGKILKPEHQDADYTHSILPDPKLLFRFSALTFNAHAIHLDPEYCRDIEGHRNLLFHGPMSFTFLVTLLQQRLAQEGNEVIKSVEYRNVAPLYCGEEVKFAGKKLDNKNGKWDIWAETPEGGIAVKGKVVTERGNVDKSELGR
ncbi:hypothetical protein BST61_g6364 [Cercospora zeina]